MEISTNTRKLEIFTLTEAVDCTNERDGLNVVVYTNNKMNFVREKTEFLEKFEIIWESLEN